MNYEISLFLTLFVFVMWKILIPIGIKSTNRENSKPIVIFILLIIVQTFLIYALYTKMLLFLYLNYYFEYDHPYYSDFIMIQLLKHFRFQFVVKLKSYIQLLLLLLLFIFPQLKPNLMFYVNNNHIIDYMIIIVIVSSVTSIFFKFELFLIGLVYALLLANILLQIKRGRFKLKVNEVTVGVLALNYGFYVPFWTEK